MLVNDMVLLKGRLGRGGSVAKQEVGCFPGLVVDDESNVLFWVCRAYVSVYNVLDDLLICLVVCRHVASVVYLDVFVVCRCSGVLMSIPFVYVSLNCVRYVSVGVAVCNKDLSYAL